MQTFERGPTLEKSYQLLYTSSITIERRKNFLPLKMHVCFGKKRGAERKIKLTQFALFKPIASSTKSCLADYLNYEP